MDENFEKNDNVVKNPVEESVTTQPAMVADAPVDVKEDKKTDRKEDTKTAAPDAAKAVDKAKVKRSKKWLVIVIAAVLVIVLAIPSGMVLNIHNSPYDCSFEYVKVDNLMTEIARKHTYYSAKDKTLEIELNQDMINSLIKDYLGKLDLNLPEKITIKEVMFNTKDQRVYINAKYGSLNTPISAKLNYKISDSGIEFSASDIKLASMNAPGFIKSQLSEDTLKYAVKYEDLGAPRIFTFKDIKFGTGTVKAVVQLDTAKILEMAMEYKGSLMGEIDKFKTNQSGIINTFLTKLLGTGILSDTKVKEYVEKALNNEELVNSAIFFATAEDLDKYTNTFQDVQKKVMDWAAPLQTIKYYGSIDETVNRVLYDAKLRDMLGWFLPPEAITEYTGTVEEYYGMYKDCYAMYEDTLASIDRAAAGMDTKQLTEFTKMVLQYTAQAEALRTFLIEQVETLDPKAVEDLLLYAENDKKFNEEFISTLDPGSYQMARAYLLDLDNIKANTLHYLKNTDISLVDDFSSLLDNRTNFIVDVIRQLKRKQYESALTKLGNDGVVNSRTKKFIDKVSKNVDSAVSDFNKLSK